MKLITKQITVVDNCATGEQMRQARLKAGLSLRELAKRLEVSAPYVSDMERGHRNWTQAKLDQWLKAIGNPSPQLRDK